MPGGGGERPGRGEDRERSGGEGLADGAMPPGGGHQEEEASTAGPEEFAPNGAVAPGGVIPLVDLAEADPEAQRPLELPPFVEQVGECVEVAIAGEGAVTVDALKTRFESWFPGYMNGGT